MDKIQEKLERAELAMEHVHVHTQKELAKVRTGRALPNMLDGLLVTHYGHATSIHQVASISSLGARTLSIKPWEQRLIPEIEKAILNSNLGITPQNDGETIHINIPPLTEERRKELVKQVKKETEKSKIAVRGVRKELKEALKQLQKTGTSEDTIKRAEEQAQKLTDTYIRKLDLLLARKEEEVMEV